MKHENSSRKTDFITVQAEPQKGLARVKGNQWKCSIVGQIKVECRIRKQEKALGGGEKKINVHLSLVCKLQPHGHAYMCSCAIRPCRPALVWEMERFGVISKEKSFANRDSQSMRQMSACKHFVTAKAPAHPCTTGA